MGEGAINGFKAISKREGNVFLERYVGRQYGMEGNCLGKGLLMSRCFGLLGSAMARQVNSCRLWSGRESAERPGLAGIRGQG